MSALPSEKIYHNFFHSAMSYGETRCVVPQFLACKKRQLELWKEVGRVSCRNLVKKLQILPLTSQYKLSLLMFVVQNKIPFSTNTENHNKDTRQRKNLYPPQANLSIYQKGAIIRG